MDSVLVDEGRSPLIISGQGDEPEGHQQRYTVASEVASHLKEGLDFTVDRKQNNAPSHMIPFQWSDEGLQCGC